MLISSKTTLCQGCFQTFGGQCIQYVYRMEYSGLNTTLVYSFLYIYIIVTTGKHINLELNLS